MYGREPNPFASPEAELEYVDAEASQAAFINKVYQWMAVGLGLTGAIAMWAANSAAARELVRGNFRGMLLLQFGIVLAFSFLAHRVPALVAAAMFIAYASLTGLVFSMLFLVFTHASIASTFFITGGTFAATSVYAHVTKKDLTSLGGFMTMGLIGLIIGSVVNAFVASTALDWFLTYAGILIFVGLTAYDTQKLKNLQLGGTTAEERQKLAINGALVLYLDFINLFLTLLRIFGKRR